ncbi:carbohydrate esterase family 9 protein [Coniochaeta ligniaria NRRL 30616]|uniref:Carbohydrate esterase family 9 protein n=1 Tax=Coniochaeta ligniaria NRRL 30616 TaxID=1408157 RepID=A0A1J7JCB8_9PEZI|nr:carbohydrate esterase family 9 protein [Coniochaeta ligniaria NRRL 30616]
MEKLSFHQKHAPWARPEGRGAITSMTGSKMSLVISLIVGIVTTLLLSSQYNARSSGADINTAQQRISHVDLDYGLTQCRLNQLRPVVDHTLPTTRLATRSRSGVRTIFTNATLINGDGTVTAECTIEMQDGIFVRVSTDPTAVPVALDEYDQVISTNLHGRFVTPGLIDMHSHAGVRATPQLWATEDVTEVSSPVTPWGRAVDAIKPTDQAIAVIGSGGVTTSLVLTGAKNLISGEGLVIKMRRADSVRDIAVNMTLAGGKPMRFLKMATGENQKRQFQNTPGGPTTRIGESYWFRRAYDSARRVRGEQDRWCEAVTTGRFMSREYPRSLEWQTLVDVLRGDVKVNVHGYESEDILAVLDHADEFGFNITALHHALHSDQVASEIGRRGIAIVGFSDSWGDKKELYNVSSYFPARLAEKGIPFVLTRDHPATHGQWLVYEAQIARHFGLGEGFALRSVMAEPARLLGLDNRIGFVRPGYDADLVVWNRHPLRVGATPLEVYIDGARTVRAPESVWKSSEVATCSADGPRSRPSEEVVTACRPGLSDLVVRGITHSFVGDDGTRGEEVTGGNLTAVIRHGRVVCIGGEKCAEAIKTALDEGVASINLENGHVIPGMTVVTRQHGLVEMRQEPSTIDGASSGEQFEKPLSSRFGIKFDGIHVERAHRSGVTRLVTPPITTGLFHGLSTVFRTGASSVLDPGAIVQDEVALHFTIGHDGKNPRTPSITSQISTLHDLLTTSKHIHPVYQRAANGSIPVVVHTNNKDVIAHMISLKRQTGAHIIIMGGQEAHLVAAELAASDVPVITAPFWGCEPLFFDSRHCLPGPPLVERLGPQVLLDAGVKVAIGNWDDTNNHVRSSPWEAGWLAGPGNRSLALDLVSRNLEEMLGLPSTRDVVIYEGDPFEFGARVAVMFEEGRVQSCYPDVDEEEDG